MLIFFPVGCPAAAMKFTPDATKPNEFFCYSAPELPGAGTTLFANALEKCPESASILACPNAHMNSIPFSTFLPTLGGTFIYII